MTQRWEGRHKFGTIVAEQWEGMLANSPQVGNIFYVNKDGGGDGLSGKTWDTALATLTQAHALCEAEGDDYIIARHGQSSFAECLTITKAKVHLLGLGAFDKRYTTRINNGGDGQPTILVQARDVEIGGIMPLGDRDNHHAAILLDGDNLGTRSYVHDCFVTMLTPSGTKYCDGIKLIGDRHTLRRIIVDSCAKGIYVTSGVQATYEILMEQIMMYACNDGIVVDSLQQSTGQHGLMADDLYIDALGAYAIGQGILVTAGNPTFRNADVIGYGTDQAGNVTVGNGKFVNCRWCQTTGVSTAFA